MPFNCLDHIVGTGRTIATGRWKEGRKKALIETNKANRTFLHYFFVFVTARVCNWLISFLLRRRYSPGRSPETSRFPNWVRDNLSTKSQRLQTSFDLVIASFMDGQLDNWAILFWVNFKNLIGCWLGLFAIDGHTTSQGTQVFFVRQSLHARNINLINLITRVDHFIRKITIIGQNQDTRSIPSPKRPTG